MTMERFFEDYQAPGNDAKENKKHFILRNDEEERNNYSYTLS